MNHLLVMIICELRKIEETEAIKKVPRRIGQNSPWLRQANLSIAPKKEMKEATRRM